MAALLVSGPERGRIVRAHHGPRETQAPSVRAKEARGVLAPEFWQKPLAPSEASCWRVWARFEHEGAALLLPTLRDRGAREDELAQACAAPYLGAQVHGVRMTLLPRAVRGRGSDGLVYRACVVAAESASGATLSATKVGARYLWSLASPLPRLAPAGLPPEAVPEALRVVEASRLPILSWALPPALAGA